MTKEGSKVPESELLALAAKQLGLFTTRQADDVEFTESMRRSRIARDLIRRVHANVFCFAGQPLSEAAKHLAAVLAADHEGTRSSHRAGAWLWGMTPHTQKPEITVAGYTRVRIKGVRVHRTATELLSPEVRMGVPTSSAAETLLDLGAVVPLEKVQSALDRGIANRVVTPMSALAELERRGRNGVRGTAALRQLLDEAGITGSHPPSVLEAKMRRLIKKAGLPQPECELIVGKHGEYRLDFCWPELMLVVEVDGWLYHSSHAAFTRNKTRKNALTVAGHSILEYTWLHVTQEPHKVIRELQSAYAARARLFSGQIPSPSNAI
jgi:hypothetical protein